MSINLMKKKIGSISLVVALCIVGVGVVAHADNYAYMSDSGGGLGIVDLTTGIYTPITASGTQLSAGLGEANGSLYGGMSNSSQLYSISTSGATAGSVTPVGSGTNSKQFVGGLGSTMSDLFALDFNEWLLSVNPATGISTTIGPTGLSRVISAWCLSTGSSSLYYAFNYNLYRIDTGTGAPTLIGPLGGTGPSATNLSFFAMVESGGTLYGVDPNDRIYTVNTSTGLATFSVQIVSASAPTTPYGNTIFGFAPYPLSSPGNAALYFPHVAANLPWQTEIALINTSASQTVTGTLEAFSDAGEIVETKDITLAALGRNEINVADEFTYFAEIRYIVFYTASDSVVGYTKFFQIGQDRAAIPAVKEVNTSDIFITHIASTVDWWTGISLVNTTQAAKQLTITFNTGQSVPYTLQANEHRAFTIESLMGSTQPQLTSAVISNASGVIGLELFGRTGGMNQLDGILLTDQTASTIYYPHVASSQEWWTGIVAYNPSPAGCAITISPYTAQGAALATSMLALAGHEKYVGLVSQLALPAETAWFKIDSTSPLSGFELFGTTDGIQLAAYAGGGSDGAKTGVFAKIEKNGWTGIAFVNMEAGAASVTLTALDDDGAIVATQVLPVAAHAKVVNFAPMIFSQDISTATYITFSSDKNVVGFQLNGSTDGTMLDGLPGLNGGGD